jgi:hypothetical protein
MVTIFDQVQFLRFLLDVFQTPSKYGSGQFNGLPLFDGIVNQTNPWLTTSFPGLFGFALPSPDHARGEPTQIATF